MDSQPKQANTMIARSKKELGTSEVNDKGNVVATRFGQLLGTFGSNEMGICKQNSILEEEINCETTLSVREAATHQSLSGGQGFFKCGCKSKCLSNQDYLEKNEMLLDVLEEKKEMPLDVLEEKKEMLLDVLEEKREMLLDVLEEKKEMPLDVLEEKKEMLLDVLEEKKEMPLINVCKKLYILNLNVDIFDNLDIPKQRTSPDNYVNSFGRKLINFCKNNNMFILNGRLFVDRVDIHSPLFLELNCEKVSLEETKSFSTNDTEHIGKWRHEKILEFKGNINIDEVDELFSRLLEKSENLDVVDQNCINVIVDDVTNILL
ncbi:unnamed protein product [Mytilus coruscus]|uniref:Uncharacterized protein n=1 Tax=Mytilus coruscus TaxID=42192 RepID=A0A6J8D033_MYTCO|nr:unnamed protein product [Mytilus coruscus]